MGGAGHLFVRGEIPVATAVSIEIAAGLAVTADRQRLQQVLLNLIRNAVEAAGAAGHVAISARRRRVAAGDDNDPGWATGCQVTGEVVDIEKCKLGQTKTHHRIVLSNRNDLIDHKPIAFSFGIMESRKILRKGRD